MLLFQSAVWNTSPYYSRLCRNTRLTDTHSRHDNFCYSRNYHPCLPHGGAAGLINTPPSWTSGSQRDGSVKFGRPCRVSPVCKLIPTSEILVLRSQRADSVLAPVATYCLFVVWALNEGNRCFTVWAQWKPVGFWRWLSVALRPGTETVGLLRMGTQDAHLDFHTAPRWWWFVECWFTSTETVGLLGTGAQDVHLDFHTSP